MTALWSPTDEKTPRSTRTGTCAQPTGCRDPLSHPQLAAAGGTGSVESSTYLQSRTRRTAASDVTYLLIEFRLADDGLRALARRRASPRRPIPGVATVILEQMGPSTTPTGR